MSHDPDDRDALLGTTLRRLRRERKLEVADVAARAGLSVVELTRLERGTYRVGLDTLVRILSALGAERELAAATNPGPTDPPPGRSTGAGGALHLQSLPVREARARRTRGGSPLRDLLPPDGNP